MNSLDANLELLKAARDLVHKIDNMYVPDASLPQQTWIIDAMNRLRAAVKNFK